MKLTATTLCLLVLPLTALAQSLAPGDLAVIGMNSDNPEAFAFVTLVDIPAGTEIKFTDNGWLAAGGFRGGEQTHTYTASTDLAAGTVVTITTDVPDFSNAGDQLLAYQGADDAPSFIYALNNKGGGLWQADATSSSTSALPPGLTDGVTAVALVEANNVVYSGTMRGSRAELLQGIGDRENWTRDNNAPQTFPAGPFDVTALTGGIICRSLRASSPPDRSLPNNALALCTKPSMETATRSRSASWGLPVQASIRRRACLPGRPTRFRRGRRLR